MYFSSQMLGRPILAAQFEMMKKILWIASIGLWLVACGEKPQNQTESMQSTAEASALTAAEKADQYARKNAGKGSFNNAENALLYMLSTGNLNLWGSLVSESSFAKDVAGGEFVVLCPTNDVLRTMDFELLSLLKLPDNKDLLDGLISNHMIKGPFEVAKYTAVTELTLHSGKVVNIDPGQSRIGGALYRKEQINTAKGAVLLMSEVIAFPEAELTKRSKKSGASKK
jgi:uncharacterized surface protein with fasciclin (FAS1) repeats